MRLVDYLKKLEVGTKVELEITINDKKDIFKASCGKLFASLKSNVLTLNVNEIKTHTNKWQQITIQVS